MLSTLPSSRLLSSRIGVLLRDAFDFNLNILFVTVVAAFAAAPGFAPGQIDFLCPQLHGQTLQGSIVKLPSTDSEVKAFFTLIDIGDITLEDVVEKTLKVIPSLSLTCHTNLLRHMHPPVHTLNCPHRRIPLLRRGCKGWALRYRR